MLRFFYAIIVFMKTTIIALDALSKNLIDDTFKQGYPIPFPTETVFGLGAPFNQEAVIKNIFQLKGRPQDNPLIVHVSRIEMIHEIAYVTEDAVTLMNAFFPGPLTLVLKKRETVLDIITAGKDTVAVRMPAHEIARGFIERYGKPLVAPSANLSGKPSATHVSHVYDDFHGSIPWIIEGEPTMIGIESTIVDLTKKPYTILRPGHIQKHDLEAMLGPVFDGSSSVVAPGMIHPHYEPSHPLWILDGSDEAIIKFMKKKDHAVFIGHQKFMPFMAHMVSLGETEADMMQTLYHVLRETNALHVDTIYTHKINHEAYMNRLMKDRKSVV